MQNGLSRWSLRLMFEKFVETGPEEPCQNFALASNILYKLLSDD